ncbi:MAG: PorT family protein [Bacteroidia bacterium]|nr:PorT family protein [Bacteroidia bacterium]NNF32143.1 PorT family protein [Flavobacteriaceae bacterium]MBT8274656.1 PorT family protein [Bacteroidia bacterium]NNJ82742.1 PorT family protein [Flavobacteriaceae bacterium]NNK55662.1 PorT family protein [Flavobacteriaceae bacterium]
MKKYILLVIAIGLFSFTAQAQGIDFGVKAGVNFANITDASGLSNRTGFVAGFFVGGKLNDNIGIQADLLYSQQGAEFEFGDFNLDYVNLPVLLKYYVSERFNIQGGPQFGIVVNDDVNATILGEIIDDLGTSDFDISAVIGLGYDLPMGLRVSGRYNIGLSDVPDDSRYSTSGKNSVVTLAVGYSFL